MQGKTNKWAKLSSFVGKSQKNKKVESIYSVDSAKETTLLMGKNSAAMGWATYMDSSGSGMNLSEQQKSEMFMNALIVHFVQIIFIGCIWKYAIDTDSFIIFPSKSPDLMVARFMGALMMHINVERDVRCGIDMMKLCVN